MRRAAFLVACCVGAVAATGALRPQPGAEAGVLTVMTFNIQHGIDGSHRYNLQRAIDTIAKVQPDLVGLQEVTKNHPYYNCDDQPKKLAAGLTAATGRQWQVAFEQEWFTKNAECKDSGRGDDTATEGLAFLAPGPLGPSSMTPLPVSRIALSVKPPSFGGAAITVTHLANGKNNAAARAKEVEAILKWTGKFGPSQIVMGDFNLLPDEPELRPMLGLFKDAWVEAKSAGAAVGNEGTHGANRIDFLFVKGDALVPVGVENVETAGWFGKAASDHSPVVGRFRLTHAVK